MMEKPELLREETESVVSPDHVEVRLEDCFDPEGMFRAGGDYSYTSYSPRKLDTSD